MFFCFQISGRGILIQTVIKRYNQGPLREKIAEHDNNGLSKTRKSLEQI